MLNFGAVEVELVLFDLNGLSKLLYHFFLGGAVGATVGDVGGVSVESGDAMASYSRLYHFLAGGAATGAGFWVCGWFFTDLYTCLNLPIRSMYDKSCLPLSLMPSNFFIRSLHSLLGLEFLGVRRRLPFFVAFLSPVPQASCIPLRTIVGYAR